MRNVSKSSQTQATFEVILLPIYLSGDLTWLWIPAIDAVESWSLMGVWRHHLAGAVTVVHSEDMATETRGGSCGIIPHPNSEKESHKNKLPQIHPRNRIQNPGNPESHIIPRFRPVSPFPRSGLNATGVPAAPKAAAIPPWRRAGARSKPAGPMQWSSHWKGQNINSSAGFRWF
jgi:hypothetical protein